MDYIPDDVGKDRSLDRSDIFPEVIRSSHEYSMLRLIPGMYNSCFIWTIIFAIFYRLFKYSGREKKNMWQ